MTRWNRWGRLVGWRRWRVVGGRGWGRDGGARVVVGLALHKHLKPCLAPYSLEGSVLRRGRGPAVALPTKQQHYKGRRV